MASFGQRAKKSIAADGDWPKPELFQETVQTFFGLAQIMIMTKTGFPAGMADSGLTRVSLPGVKVKDERLFFLLVYFFQGHFGEPIGEDTEIASAGHWYFSSPKKGC